MSRYFPEDLQYFATFALHTGEFGRGEPDFDSVLLARHLPITAGLDTESNG